MRKDSDYNANTKFHTNVKINFNTDLSGYDIETDGSNYKLSYAGNDNLKDKNKCIEKLKEKIEENIKEDTKDTVSETEE